MATRSTIAILNENGTVDEIYCHFDGYVRGGVGMILQEYYSTEELVRNLIGLGGLVSLAEDIDSVEAFSKHRGAPLRIYSHNSFEDYILSEKQEFNYLFDCKSSTWSFTKQKRSFRYDLTTELNGVHSNV